MKESVISRNLQTEMMKFFLNTSVPRIINKDNIESIKE